MKRFFKRQAESELGSGTVYIEITDNWPSRQIEVYGEKWRWGNEDHPEYLADQPLEVLELLDEYAISAEEFEEAWYEAIKRCPPSL